jgi:hypothetical protein
MFADADDAGVAVVVPGLPPSAAYPPAPAAMPRARALAATAVVVRFRSISVLSLSYEVCTAMGAPVRESVLRAS